MPYVILRTDGGVSVFHPPAEWDDAAVQAYVDTVKDCLGHHPDTEAKREYVSHHKVPDVPDDRTFRDAWCLRDGKCDHDMPKARDLARNHIRRARAPKLAALDAEVIKADERGDAAEKQRHVARKQRLRDAPADARLTDAADAAALKTAMLAIAVEVEQA